METNSRISKFTVGVGGLALAIGIWLPWIKVRPNHSGPIPGIYYPGMDSGIEFLDWFLLGLLFIIILGFVLGFSNRIRILFSTVLFLILAAFIFLDWILLSIFIIFWFALFHISDFSIDVFILIMSGITSATLSLRYMYMQVGIFGYGETSYVENTFVADIGIYLSVIGSLLLIISGVLFFYDLWDC